jgi:fatty acid desaturase
MDANQRPPRRQTFLTVFLALLLGVFALLVLILVSGGFFLYVIYLALAVAGLALIHYVLWGRAMSRSVAGEREEEQLRQRAAADDWPLPDPNSFRRR